MKLSTVEVFEFSRWTRWQDLRYGVHRDNPPAALDLWSIRDQQAYSDVRVCNGVTDAPNAMHSMSEAAANNRGIIDTSAACGAARVNNGA